METRSRVHKAIKITAKILGLAVGVLVLCVLLLALALSFRSVRTGVLARVLDRADNSIPGTIRAATAQWPEPGRIEIEKMVWVDQADTLCTAGRVVLHVKLLPFFTRDVRVTELRVEGIKADLPQIKRRFPGRDTGTKDRGKHFFPREGSVPGVPSISIDHFNLTASTILGIRDSLPNTSNPADGTLTAQDGRGQRVNRLFTIDAAGSIDLSRGRLPQLFVERLTAADSESGASIDGLRLDVDLASVTMTGAGSGHITPQLPFFLNLESPGANQFNLFVSFSEDKAPPNAPGIAVSGALERRGLQLLSLRFEATVKTPGSDELARIFDLERHLKNFTVLDGISAVARGRAEFHPVFSAGIEADLLSNQWLEGGRAALLYRDHALIIDSVMVTLPDLTIAADAALDGDSIAAMVSAKARGTRWLANTIKNFKAPDSLYADVSVKISGARQAPSIALQCDASGRKGALDIQKLRVGVKAPGGENGPIAMRLEAQSPDFAVSTNARVEGGASLEIRLAPLHVQASSDPVRTGLEAARTGLVKYGGELLTFTNFRVAGALGDFRADGEINKDLAGFYELHCRWKNAPDALITYLNLPADVSDSLRTRWLAAGPFGMDIKGQITSDSSITTNRIETKFELPGPAVFSPMFPRTARLDDMGPVRGRFIMGANSAKASVDYTLDLDLNPTDWIDSSKVELSGTESSLEIGTVELGIEGAALTVAGRIRDKTLDLRCEVDVPGAGFLRRFGVGDETLDLVTQARIDLSGDIGAPEVAAVLTGHASARNFRLPRFSATLNRSSAGLAVHLDMPQGVSTEPVKLSRAAASYESKSIDNSALPGEVVLSGSGNGIDFYHKTNIVRTADRLTVRGDTLSLNLGGRDMRTTQPFRIDMFPKEKRVVIDGLRLSGSLGDIRAEGNINRDNFDLNCFADLVFPSMPSSLDLPPAVWPERFNLRLLAADRNLLRAEANVLGVAMPDNRHPDIRLDVYASTDTLFGTVNVIEKKDSMVTCSFKLPTAVSLYPFKAQLRDAPLHCDLKMNGFPVPTEFRAGILSGTRHARCDASVRARGTPASPYLSASANVTFPGWPELSPYQMKLEARLGTAGYRDELPAREFKTDTLKPRTIEDFRGYEGLAAVLTVEKSSQRLIESTFLLPLSFSALPLLVELKEGGEMEFSLFSGELTLSEFDALIPPNMEIDGKCKLDLTASGPVDQPEFDGVLEVPNMRLTLADGSRVSTQGTLRFGGTSKRPSLKGEIEIHNGVLQVPDPPKNLHPAEGTAILWEEQTHDSLPGDGEPKTLNGKESESGPKEKIEAEVEVSIKIPSGLWIRGQGLDVELAGELRLAQKGLYPRVVGELHVVRGGMVFIGRNFNVDKGAVLFYGEDEINPTLDIALTTNVEGVTIRIQFRGTVKKPEISLTSEPEMPEGDILSFLIFGKPISDLDHDQTAMVQRRAGEFAAAFGLTQLQIRLARQLGVDMISIEKSGKDESQKSLVIGKYLSRRVLLKYGQMLEEQSNFYVNLEYFLTRSLKIETIIGRQQQSGIEAGWTKEY